MKSFMGIILSLFSANAFAGTAYTPIWSQISMDDAANQCAAQGTAVGQSMETTTATGGEFYIVACARPDGNGGITYVPAWSAISFENARERCQTQSVTTGLDAGVPVGSPVYAQASTSDIFIVVCQTSN